MRRFVSYLALCLGALTIIGTTFAATTSKANPSYEYKNSTAFTYRLSGDDFDDKSQASVSEIMEDRLKTAGITGYSIDLEGNDSIEVTYSQGNDDLYTYIRDYLTINGSFAFGTKNNVMAVGSEFRDTSRKAYLTFNDVYPTVVLPINSESAQFKSIIEDLDKIYEENKSAAENASDEEQQTADQTFLYVMCDYKEGDLISEIIEGSSDYDSSKYRKSLMQFVYSPDGVYYDSNKTEIAVSINIGSDGYYSASDLRNATALGNFFVNCLNASTLPCDVNFIYSQSVAPVYENVISLAGLSATPAMSGLLIGTLICIVFVSLILVLFYKWGALSIATTTIASTYLALITSIFFKAELSLSGIIGLMVVALVSLASGIILFSKIKEECYRGRSLRKADSEGHKKALLAITDVHVALIIIGIFTFIFGGTTLAPFAAATVFGSICSIILNLLGMKGLTWLLCNTTKFVGKYEVIGVESKNVPDILKEEKQNYYGPYQNRDLGKHYKKTAIIGASLGLVAIAGTIVFGLLGGGAIFNHSTSSQVGSVTFETTSSNIVYDVGKVEDILSKTQVSFDNGSTYKPLEYGSLLSYERTVTEKDESDSNVNVTYTYVVCDLKQNYASNLKAKYVNGATTIEEDLDAIFDEIVSFEDSDSKCVADYRAVTHIDSNLPNAPMVIAGVGVGVTIVCLYLALRYGLSRGISAIAGVTVSTIIPVGFLALTRIIAAESFIYVAPFTAIVALVIAIIFFNKDKEMAREDFVRTKDNSALNRESIMKKSTPLAFAPALIFAVIAIYFGINFAGFASKGTTVLFLMIVLGAITSIVLLSICLMPLAQNLFKKFEEHNVRVRLPKKNKKKSLTPKVRSAEPEEAIFIGIND